MGTEFSLHTHLQEVPVLLLNHLFHWLSLHPPGGGNGSLRYEQHFGKSVPSVKMHVEQNVGCTTF